MDGPSTLGCGAFQVEAFLLGEVIDPAKAIFHEPSSWGGVNYQELDLIEGSADR
jgi:hypothetical protein